MIFLPWVATQDAKKSQSDAFECAIFFYGLLGIFGTGWIKNAI